MQLARLMGRGLLNLLKIHVFSRIAVAYIRYFVITNSNSLTRGKKLGPQSQGWVGFARRREVIGKICISLFGATITFALSDFPSDILCYSLVPRPSIPQLRVDYITATWKEGLAHRSNILVLTCFECLCNYCVVICVVIV